MLHGRDQAGAHGRVVLGDRAEPAVVTAQALEEGGQLADPVDLRDDLHERFDEAPALGGHRDREHVPRLGVLDEQVRVEEQR
jgi:hypothetical protein